MEDIEILEVISNTSTEKDVEILTAPGLITPIRKRPVRTRRPVRTLLEEDEGASKSKPRNKRPRRSRSVGMITLDSSLEITPKASFKSKTLKRKGSVTVLREVKPKVPRVEVGGAGTLKSSKKYDDDIQILFEWDPATVISERQSVDEWQARNVINLFDQENTLPFIARYRKEKTGNLEVEKLREIQNAYSQLKLVKERVIKVIKNEDAASQLPDDRKAALLQATTVHEIEHLTASLKGSGKHAYAERAKELGLEPHAKALFEGQQNCIDLKGDLINLVNPSKDGLKTVDEVETGIQHIIADIVHKDPKVLEFVKQLMRSCKPTLECSRKAQRVRKALQNNALKSSEPKENLCAKYETYFDYKNLAWNVRPHQMLAMNRGEHQNVLHIRVVIPDAAYMNFTNFCHSRWLQLSPQHSYRTQLILSSIEDGWHRLVKPFMQRQIKSQLTEMAQIASVDVFTANLRKLLLTPPLRGITVLAIDPGFVNGCKIAVTNVNGEYVLTTTIYPFGRNVRQSFGHWNDDHNARTLREIVNKHGCELFAVGNGTACREMEAYLSHLISSGCFSPYNVQYTIVNEAGASQYSCSPEAKEEFPSMDPNHISAVSLCRRLQDPLLEYVKVHPKHLGVGMYQHDIPEKLINASLDSVMIECVSFVGVDINVASEYVLRKLSGLTKLRAAKIVAHRKAKGPFVNREQIKDVKGIGPQTFEQCAGFIRILPQTLEQQIQKTPIGKRKAQKLSVCYLDRTMIHPESYEAATKFLNLIGVKQQEIGSQSVIPRICNYVQNSSLGDLATKCGTTFHTMQLIAEGLTQPIDFDMRAQFEKPLFRKGVTSIDDLKVGTNLTGRVSNVIHFGAFVDIGVGQDALIHISRMNGMKVELGTNVDVTVTNVEKQRKRINLSLNRVLG